MSRRVVACPCGKKYVVSAEMQGKKVKCSACDRAFVVTAEPLPATVAASAPKPVSSDSFGSFFDQNLPSAAALSTMLTAPPPAPVVPSPPKQVDPTEKERAEIDAELSDLKDQLKEEFQIGHAILKARGRLNEQIEYAQANAPTQTSQVGGLQATSFFAGLLSGIGGMWVAMALSAFWPTRTTKATISFGKDELAGLNAASAYGRRRAVSTQARLSALETILGKETPWAARVASTWGSTICGGTFALGFVILALLMSFLNPLFGILFLPVAVYGGFRVRRELTAIEQAIQDYPHLASRFGRRRINRLVTALAILVVMLITLAAASWIGFATYQWGQDLVSRLLKPAEEQRDPSAEKESESAAKDDEKGPATLPSQP